MRGGWRGERENRRWGEAVSLREGYMAKAVRLDSEKVLPSFSPVVLRSCFVARMRMKLENHN